MREKQNKISTDTEDVSAGITDASVKPLSEGVCRGLFYGIVFYGIQSHSIPTETEMAVAI